MVDCENPALGQKLVEAITGDVACPTCQSPLRDALLAYPENFRFDDGSIGYFTPDKWIPPDSESLIIECFTHV